MNPLDWILNGRFGAAVRAGAGFVTVSIVGAIGLVVVAIVLWAASLTPFGLWAGVPVIAAGVLVALLIWRQGRAKSVTGSVSLEPLSWSQADLPRWPEKPELGVATKSRVKLIGPTPFLSRMPRLADSRSSVKTEEDLKRMFDQAFAAAQFDEADRVLTELALMPNQGEWTRRKRRLVRQQRARC